MRVIVRSGQDCARASPPDERHHRVLLRAHAVIHGASSERTRRDRSSAVQGGFPMAMASEIGRRGSSGVWVVAVLMALRPAFLFSGLQLERARCRKK